MSWKSSCQYREPAIDAVRRVVKHLRQRGLKSEHALDLAAPELGITRRRARTLFYADGEPVVLRAEWDRLRARAASMLRREADELRFRAEQMEAEADQLERQESLPLFDKNKGAKCSNQPICAMAQRYAA